MSRHGALVLSAFCACCLCAAGMAQNFATLTERAVRAYQAKDYATFLTLEKQALTTAPLDPRTIYNVACGEALTGHPAESVRLLDQLVTLGLDFDADKDPDLAGIAKSSEWSGFLARLAELRKPIIKSSVAFTLPEKGLVATSVAMDAATGDVYVASARERKIVRHSKQGVISEFATQKDGLLAVSYLLIDAEHRQLIASHAAVPFMQNYDKDDEGKTGLVFFDLATGKLVRSVTLSAPSGHHLLNESVMDKSGNVFVVDSGSSEIYRLRRASDELELFVSSVQFPALQGLALSADEQTLYVADYIQGLWAMEVLSNDRKHIDAPPDLFMAGLLGIARTRNGFVAVQKGVRPNRVVRIRLDAKGERVASLDTLERNHPDYAGPTQGSLADGDFLYIANSQINLLDPKTRLFPQDLGQPTKILRLAIGE